MTLDLKELRRKAEAATPGAWVIKKDSRVEIHSPTTGLVGMTSNKKWREDADFIAAANPAVILALLDRVEAFSSALDMTVACGLPRNCHIPNCKYNDGGQEVCTWHSHFENAQEVLKRFEGDA